MRESPTRSRPIAAESEPVSRRTIVSRVVLGIVAVALLAGMVVQFTPNLGGASGPTQTEGATVMSVNGAPVSEREYQRSRSGNQLLSLGLGGVIGQDLENLLVDQIVLINAAQQDAGKVRVGQGDVRNFINNFRNQRQLTKDSDYLNFVQSQGFTDASFRDAVRKQLQLNKRIEEITGAVKVTDEELKFFFEQNKQNYKNEERILARQIVVNDQKAADDAQAQLKSGKAFAEVAKALSKEGADADGALGAKKGEKTPQPIARLALNAKVAEAAFKLTSGGTTETIADGGKFYIVNVEKYLAAGPQTFEEAKTKLEADAKAAKQNQAIEEWVRKIQGEAKVTFPTGSSIKYYNPVVAKVGDREIKLGDLNREVYQNPQIGQFIQQGGAQNATLITQFFKPQALDNLINQAIAANAAATLKQPFIGAARDILAAAQAYAAKDVTVSDAEVRKFYDDNIATYSTSANANIAEATFNTLESARAFRSAFIAGGKDFTKDAAKQQGTVNELGVVGADNADPAYKKAIFEVKALTKAGDGQVSEVIEKDKKFKVLYVTALVEKSTKPFDEVKADASDKALAAKKAKAGQTWLEGQKKTAKITKNLDAVNKELEERAKKADAAKAKPPTPPASPTPPAGTPK